MLTCQSLQQSILHSAIVVLSLLGITSCGQREIDSKTVANELNKPKSDITKERDERFLVKAAEINFEEIMLAKLVQQRSMNEEIKVMAKMFEDAHRAAGSAVNGFALTKSIAVPTSATIKVMADYDRLSEQEVKDFDATYCSMIVEAHKEAINHFESYTNGACDEDIKVWALGMIPEMRVHLQKATEMESLMENPVSELILDEKAGL